MKIVSAVILASSLAFAASGSGASPSSLALDEFQNRCAALVANRDVRALSGLKALPENDARRVRAALGGNSDTRIWFTPSDRYFLVTFPGADAVCQVIGVNVDFADLRAAFLEWRERFGDGFRSDGDLELRLLNRAAAKMSAGVFLARPIEEGGVLQMTVHYRPDVLEGFASITLVRLSDMSPAAKELLQGE